MDGFEKRRQQKKESILKAAQQLFKQYGYNKVSIAEIAAKADVSQVSIYNFFQSKENLKHELLKKLIDEHFSTMLEILESNNSTQVKLKKIFSYRVYFLQENAFHFMLESIRDGLINRKEYLDPNVLQKMDSLLMELYENGKQEGILNTKVSIEAISTFTDIVQYYFLNNPEASTRFQQYPELFQEVLTLYLDTIFPK